MTPHLCRFQIKKDTYHLSDSDHYAVSFLEKHYDTYKRYMVFSEEDV